jgi:hypothetical protein
MAESNPYFSFSFEKKKQLLGCLLTLPNQAELEPQTQQA